MRKLHQLIIVASVFWISWTNSGPVTLYYRTNFTSSAWSVSGTTTGNIVGVNPDYNGEVVFFKATTTNGTPVTLKISSNFE